MPFTRPDNAPPFFHVMAKPTGAICNLDCKYCFFLSKEALYPGSPFRMRDDVLEAYIKQIIESQRAPQITVAWQGGEPTLMGLEFFQRAMALVEKYAPPGTPPSNIAFRPTARFWTTRGAASSVSTSSWSVCRWTGRARCTTRTAWTKAARPPFTRSWRRRGLLQKHNVQFNILCTVHAANAEYPLEVYRFFRDEVEASSQRELRFSSNSSPSSSAPRQSCCPSPTKAGVIAITRLPEEMRAWR